MRRLVITMAPDLRAHIEATAKSEGVSVSEWVRRACSAWAPARPRASRTRPPRGHILRGILAGLADGPRYGVDIGHGLMVAYGVRRGLIRHTGLERPSRRRAGGASLEYEITHIGREWLKAYVDPQK